LIEGCVMGGEMLRLCGRNDVAFAHGPGVATHHEVAPRRPWIGLAHPHQPGLPDSR
jgi:hypothetical protein